MADQRITERLQPSLLDRLTDDAPTERAEAPDTRAIDIRRLRNIVRRDLAWLLNTHCLESELPEGRFPQARASVLNYGIAGVGGTFVEASRAEEIRRAIHDAITLFEPRIDPDTLEVRLAETGEGRRSVVVFDISGRMWAQPLPLELYLRSEIDVSTGQVQLEQRG